MKKEKLLDQLNKKFNATHTAYERLFWDYYMGDHAKGKAMGRALKARDAFRADPKNPLMIKGVIKSATSKEKERLGYWLKYFSKYQTPPKVLALKNRIGELETKIHTKRESQKEGYIDPYSKKFIKASRLEMRTIMRTNRDERIRRACWQSLEKFALLVASEFLQLVRLRNEFAQALGYANFFEYKLRNDEGMTVKALFKIFDRLYNKTKHAFAEVKKMEKKMPGLRKPWNYGFMLSGDFTKEEDQYFQFDQALIRWGQSFAALGYGYEKGTVKMDLLDRQGKYNNGFCHYPQTVYGKEGKIMPGTAGLTCNVVYGQVGSGVDGYTTLFHEGAHACDRLNSKMADSCINHEYPPASTSWAETHSMFADTMFSSIEWKTRYAKNKKGRAYPFSLYERKVRRLNVVAPLRMMSILEVSNFERLVYTDKKLTVAKIKKYALDVDRKFASLAVSSYSVLNTPHIYSWESSCYYQGYGLAELTLNQWREYFYKKYGYIVDNPNVGREVKKLWAQASSKTFSEFVKLATGKNLSPDSYIKNVTRSVEATLELAKKRIKRMDRVPIFKGKVNLNGRIEMWHGTKKICDSGKSFEDMANKYGEWLNSRDT